MTTKTITIKAAELQGELGRPQGVPFRWLVGLVDDMRKRVPDDEEESCRVHGAAGLTFTYEHTMTEAEVQAARIEHLEAKLAAVRALLPASGPATVDGDALRGLLGA